MVRAAVIAFCLTLVAAVASAAPRTVVSLSPLHSIVASVMQGVGSPELLLKGAASPHGYALKPSEAAALQSAELIVWIGPNLEGFLAGAIDNLEDRAHVLTAATLPGVERLDGREGGIWEGHDHDHGHADDKHDHGHAKHDDDQDHAKDKHDHGHAKHDDDHDHAKDKHDHGHAKHDDDDHDHAKDKHDHGHAKHDHDHGHDVDLTHVDGHLWLDPGNAIAIARAVATELAELDAANAATYRANADAFAKRLATLEQSIAADLAPVRDRRYIVFHDAYQYFERHFGTAAAGSITVSPDRKPGARRISDIRKRLVAQDVVCVFREPQFAPDIVNTIVEGTSARAGVLDPLGANIEPGADAYPTLLRRLADALVGCLGA